MCPRQGSNFLLLRQKKVTKEKASRIRRPSAALRARCVARDRREAQKLATLKHLRFLIRRSLRYSPPHYGGDTRTNTDAAINREARTKGRRKHEHSMLGPMRMVRILSYVLGLVCLSACGATGQAASTIPPHVHIQVVDKNINIWLPLGGSSAVTPKIFGKLKWDGCGSEINLQYCVIGTGRIVHGRNSIEITESSVQINGLVISEPNAVAEPDGTVIPGAFIRTFQ